MNSTDTKFWTAMGVLATALVVTLIALTSYTTSAYKCAMENRERIAVLESTQKLILAKVTEIGRDVKDLLSADHVRKK